MKRQDITKSQIDSLRQYRVWVYWSAAVSFLILVLFAILKTLYASPVVSLVSESFDNILFEVMIACAGAAFSTALIGIIYEKFQTKIVHDDSLVRERFIEEGILRVFKSSTDSQLLEFMHAEIKASRSEVIAIGLGLGVLSHNYQLLEAIADKINSVDNFRLKIFLGSSENNGVINRIKEEKLTHDKNKLNYDESWIKRYPSEITGVLNGFISDKCKYKFVMKEIDSCPMLSVVKIDDIFLFFPYGTPNIKGSHSPWIVIDGSAEHSAMAKFLKNIVKFYD
ncbi:hypothetical protein [Dyadobacter sp. CY343]|uniref:hypothetical protein n=1 Tax=Dyadobacter sp. CY343 TaxID=2907299 RepID=UPI001F2DB414|nr:hypothetical protein [Dyadobacter sp. CY343]MCE7062358.1 hypothetical protein [Dyadobacter sp. CY343]